MGVLIETKSYQTINIRFDNDICTIQINRPDANNAINEQLIAEISEVVQHCANRYKVIVLEGSAEVFCFGADFKEIQATFDNQLFENYEPVDPTPLYELWTLLATGPFVSIAHVRGKVNAGGVGFVAACDLVLSDSKAMFSLSELLFGLIPACVLPFLIRRIGYPKANYMTLATQPVSVHQALEWGLVDAFEENSQSLLRKHLLRIRRITPQTIQRYKNFQQQISATDPQIKHHAVAMNRTVFSDKENLEKISRYVSTGQFPWE
ncbi:enoyl-CoA hydratase/isomerase [Aliikangiella maris]|uniref:Enoyl-CoA hydratase/isomerase n=2 Tax=Aliikangiella maris TaxID=3162458 RepID=A0ABV2BU04_9GAMM